MSFGRGAALLLAAVLVVAGVAVLVNRGQRVDDQQEAAYRVGADAACKRAYDELGLRAPPRPATALEVVQALELSVPAIAGLDQDLHRLRPSEGQRSNHREMLAVATEQRLMMQRAQYEAKVGEYGRAIADWQSLGESGRRFDDAARNLHLRVCPTSPRIGSVDRSRTQELARIRRKVRARLAAGRVGPAPVLAPDGSQPRRGPKRPASTLYLVPMDGVPVDRMEILAQDVRPYLRNVTVRTRIMPRLYTERHEYDETRHQIAGDKLLDRLIAVYPFDNDRGVIGVIGVTDGDLYLSTSADRFVLGLRDLTVGGSGGWGVVSTARLDPPNTGLLPDDGLFRERLKKMAGRYIGAFLYPLKLNSARPNSLFRPTVPSVETLDAMTDRFCEDRPFPIVSQPC